MISPLQNLGAKAAEFSTQRGAGSSNESGETPFVDTLKSAMEQIGSMQADADSKVAQLLNGNGQDVHSAMIAVEKANLSFQMMVQVRNKIVQAYQQISAMPF
jgi:flagellar hook-basal body complex protein FliE